MFLKSGVGLEYLWWPDAPRRRRGISSSKALYRGRIQKIAKNNVEKTCSTGRGFNSSVSAKISTRDRSWVNPGSIRQKTSSKKHHRKNIIEKNIFEKTSSKKHHPKNIIEKKHHPKKNIIRKTSSKKTSSKKNIIGRNTFRCFLLELRKAMEEER